MAKFKTYSIASDTLNSKLDEPALDSQLRADATIGQYVDGINREQGSDNFEVYLTVEIDATKETAMDAVISAHDGSALEPEPELVTIKEQPPFAKPDYRTKRDAISAWETVTASQNKVIDFLISEERYVTGGEIIFKDAKEGDYISAEVYDKDNVIPEAYRAALCENHPTVAKYVIKKWLKPTESGKYDSFMIDTYPLNAKISAGLYLRVTYHSSAETGDRKIAINYHLTKSLL